MDATFSGALHAPTPSNVDPSIQSWDAVVHSRVDHLNNILPSLPRDEIWAAQKTIHDEIHAMEPALSTTRRRYNALSTISRLPPEMLARIFAACVVAEPPTRDDDRAYLGWIVVTHVCRHWRSVALKISELWTRVSCSLGPTWAEEMVVRSRSMRLVFDWEVDLTVHIRSSFPWVTPAVIKHLPRTKKLCFLPRYRNDPLMDALAGRAPSLESLSIILPRKSSGLVGIPMDPCFLGDDASSRLRHLSISNAVVFPWTSPSLRNLVSFEIGFRDEGQSPTALDYVLSALEGMPHLELLQFNGCPWDRDTVSSVPSHRTIALLQLKTMRLSAPISECVVFLGHVKAPTRSSLDLTATMWRSSDEYQALFSALDAYLRGGLENGMHRRPLSTLKLEYLPHFARYGFIMELSRQCPDVGNAARTVRLPTEESSPTVKTTIVPEAYQRWKTFDSASIAHLIAEDFTVDQLHTLHLATETGLADLFRVTTAVREVNAELGVTRLLHALTPEPDGGGVEGTEILLPRLESLTISEMDFRDDWHHVGYPANFRELQKCLEGRAAAGHAVEEIFLLKCTISWTQVAALRARVETLWDGRYVRPPINYRSSKIESARRLPPWHAAAVR